MYKKNFKPPGFDCGVRMRLMGMPFLRCWVPSPQKQLSINSGMVWPDISPMQTVALILTSSIFISFVFDWLTRISITTDWMSELGISYSKPERIGLETHRGISGPIYLGRALPINGFAWILHRPDWWHWLWTEFRYVNLWNYRSVCGKISTFTFTAFPFVFLSCITTRQCTEKRSIIIKSVTRRMTTQHLLIVRFEDIQICDKHIVWWIWI